MKCPACGIVSPEGFKFCGGCGGPLAAAAAGTVAPAAPHLAEGFRVRPVADERRTVTILFADMSGFTALSETLDPEDVQEIMTQVFGRLAVVVKDFGGTIDKYIGDAIMALFGAPIALGDDAERAVRAGLGMQKALAGMPTGTPARWHAAVRRRARPPACCNALSGTPASKATRRRRLSL